MPLVEPLAGSTLIACMALAATVLCLWCRPSWLWMVGLAVTVVAAAIAGIMDGPAGLSIFLLAVSLQRRRLAGGTLSRVSWGIAVAAIVTPMALHRVPGFSNPLILRDVAVSPGGVPYTLYVNFDKTLAGVLVLAGAGVALMREARPWHAALGHAAQLLLATVVVTMAASLAIGFVRFEPHWTWLFWIWAPINLLLTCMSEEAFFRAFLQREVSDALTGRRHAVAIAVAVSAIGFGLAHAAGGWRYVLLATLAGTGYALVFQRTGRVEMAILTHFLVNATHFLLFTYPSLA